MPMVGVRLDPHVVERPLTWRARAGAGSAHSAEHRVTGPKRTFCDGHHIGMAAGPISILPKAGWTAFRFPQIPELS
jgi:hypothetical protein